MQYEIPALHKIWVKNESVIRLEKLPNSFLNYVCKLVYWKQANALLFIPVSHGSLSIAIALVHLCRLRQVAKVPCVTLVLVIWHAWDNICSHKSSSMWIFGSQISAYYQSHNVCVYVAESHHKVLCWLQKASTEIEWTNICGIHLPRGHVKWGKKTWEKKGLVNDH